MIKVLHLIAGRGCEHYSEFCPPRTDNDTSYEAFCSSDECVSPLTFSETFLLIKFCIRGGYIYIYIYVCIYMLLWFHLLKFLFIYDLQYAETLKIFTYLLWKNVPQVYKQKVL